MRGKGKKEVYCSGMKADKSKVFPFQASKALDGSGGFALLILNLGTRGMQVIDFTSRLLYHREEHLDPLNRRHVGPQGQNGRYGEKKNIFPFRNSKPGHSRPTTLLRLPDIKAAIRLICT